MKRSESWKTLKSFPNYAVSFNGKIKVLKNGKILKQRIHFGYFCVMLYADKNRSFKRVHRLVMEAFVKKSKSEVNHIDGNKTNNKLSNLEYSTRSLNMIHAFKTGLIKKQLGENNCHHKLKDLEVKEIRILINMQIPNIDIAKIYKVDPSLISHIKRGYVRKVQNAQV